MRQQVRVVLADAQDVFVEGLSMVLAGEGDVEVVAVAGDDAAAFEAVVAHDPDVLVVDPDLPGGGVGRLLALIGRSGRDTRVLLLGAGRNGAGMARPDTARLSKSASGRDLAAAIRALADGRELPPSGDGGGAPALTAVDEHLALLLGTLSGRERQILALVASGLSNRRIAEECYLSLNTVRTHVQNVLVKLGVHSKLEAAALVVRHGPAAS